MWLKIKSHSFRLIEREEKMAYIQNVSCIVSFWLGIYHPWASHTISAQVTHSYISGELKRNNEDGCRERPRKKNFQKFFPIILEFLCFFKTSLLGSYGELFHPFLGEMSWRERLSYKESQCENSSSPAFARWIYPFLWTSIMGSQLFSN